MTASGLLRPAPPAPHSAGSPSSSGARVNDAGSAGVFADLLDGEPLDALPRDDAADWGDDAAMANALLGDFGTAAQAGGRETVGDAAVASQPPPAAAPPSELLMLHPCLDATHTWPCAMCAPAPAEGEEGACGFRRIKRCACLPPDCIAPTGDYELVGENGKVRVITRAALLSSCADGCGLA